MLHKPWMGYQSTGWSRVNRFMGVAEVLSVVGIGAGIAGSVMQSNATTDAAQMQADAANSSTAEQRRQFDIQQTNMKPWLDAGIGAVNQLSTGLNPGGQFSTVPQFQFDPSKVTTDPGYAFRQQQGVNALTAAGAAGGNLGSGNLGVALTNYGQQLGSQEYQNAYQRAYGQQMDQFNSQLNAQNTLFNRLSGVAGTGQTAATQLGAAGANMAANVGNTLMTSAANRGQLGVQGAQAWGNGLMGAAQTGINAYGAYNQNQLYQNYLTNQQYDNMGNSGWGTWSDGSSANALGY